jgi:hypothetical protein
LVLARILRERSAGEAVNRGVVEIETSGSAGMSVRMVEDLAN